MPGRNKENMNRIAKKFADIRKKKVKAFIVYLTCGDPRLSITENLIIEFEKRGVDMIELGVPFSDPLADGTTIQRASQRALRNKISLGDILGLVRNLRKKNVEIPLVLFSYYNPVYKYGVKKLARDLDASGLDGVIIPDLPPEEGKILEAELARYGLDMAYLIAPTSSPQRVKMIARESDGFIYYVSRTGTTGTKKTLAKDIRQKISQIRRVTRKPVIVGFGVSNPEQVRMISGMAADGVVVGSAIIDVIEKNLGEKDLVKTAGNFVQRLARASKEI